MAAIADDMIARGVKVLAVATLDPASGATILAKARAAGVRTVDYDRLTLGGGADAHVGFDAVAVGELQGRGLIECLDATKVRSPKVAVLNGSPTDNNATLAKQGYDGAINPKFAAKEWVEIDDQSVPGADPAVAGPMVEQMLARGGGRLDGVLAPSDAVAGVVIGVLRANGVTSAVVTGQDATVDGLRNVLRGTQCMTVYKPVRTLATRTVEQVQALLGTGDSPANTTVRDTMTGRAVPAVLVAPLGIRASAVASVVADGYVDRAELCRDLAEACTAAGIP